MINNYRVNFGGADIDYKSDFKSCRQYFPVLKKLYALMKEWGVEDCWHFFEPYVEFTWVPQPYDDCDNPGGMHDVLLQKVIWTLAQEGIEPTLIHRPRDGVVVDWYCKNPKEQEFGYKTYALSAKMAMLFWRYREAIEKGCGEKNQYMRRPHVLANQIGMNYDEEAQALWMRAELAKLFWEEDDHAEAVRIYESEFDTKYL